MADERSLKQRIRSGEIVVGVSASLSTSRSQLEDMVGKDAYGFVSVDSQHSPYNEERLVEFCGTAEEVGIPV